MSTSYDPEGDMMEDNDGASSLDTGSSTDKVLGGKVFSRGAPGPELTSSQALSALGLQEEASEEASEKAGSSQEGALRKLLPIQIELLDKSKLSYQLANQGISVAGYDTLFIIPKPELVTKKIEFTVEYGSGMNKKETTCYEIEADQKPEPSECTLEDPNGDKCLSQKEEVKLEQRKAKEANENFKPKKAVPGLMGKGSAIGAKIKTKYGKADVFSSSREAYRVAKTYSHSVEAVLDITEVEKITSNTSGSTSSSQKIIETRLIVENRTTAEKLSKAEPPTPSELSSREGYTQSSNASKVVYSCAGFVSSLPTTVTSGLESLDMSISDSGFSATYSYSTRPPVFPSQDLARVVNGSDSSSPAFQVR
jgi:hypothetical protein